MPLNIPTPNAIRGPTASRTPAQISSPTVSSTPSARSSPTVHFSVNPTSSPIAHPTPPPTPVPGGSNNESKSSGNTKSYSKSNASPCEVQLKRTWKL